MNMPKLGDVIIHSDDYRVDVTKRWWNQMQRARREDKDYPPDFPRKIQHTGYTEGGMILRKEELKPYLEWESKNQ